VAHILAQIAEWPVEDWAPIIFWLALLLLPLILLVVLMISYGRYLRFVRAHVERTVEHWERIESLLAQIAANTGPKRE
jgi:hypothetical protein